MAIQVLETEEFLAASRNGVLLDVRSPAEHAQGHIPGARPFPLFTDEERATVGTLYKQQGREAAIEKGFELVGPKLAGWLRQAREEFGGKPLFLHCWRGGMRSANMAWLFDTAGHTCFTLHGGYKAYRNLVIADIARPWPFIVLGGYTGSRKTQVLWALKGMGEQVLDLEAMANHRGSAFGKMGGQPTTEQFSNHLHEALCSFDPAQPIWIEDESRLIGTVYLPDDIYNQKTNAPLVFLDVPKDVRTLYLVDLYGKAEREKLAEGFERIRKRLGGQHYKTAIEALESDDLITAAFTALTYYDKAYDHGLERRDPERVLHLEAPNPDPEQVATMLLALKPKITEQLWSPSA